TNRPHRMTRLFSSLEECLRLYANPTHCTIRADNPMLDIIPSVTCWIVGLLNGSGDNITVFGMNVFKPCCETNGFILCPTANRPHFWRPVDRLIDLVVIEYSKTCNAYSLPQEFFRLEKCFLDALALGHIDRCYEKQFLSFEKAQRSHHEVPNPFRPVLRRYD